uniref:Uncharacterized protein n=1 Tax=Rhizophora mucronata TaxID=61149 RepID=A0A2P2Q0R4_RHIMU
MHKICNTNVPAHHLLPQDIHIPLVIVAPTMMRDTKELKLNQLKGVKLDWKDIEEQLNERQKLWQRKICVIFLFKESKQREID